MSIRLEKISKLLQEELSLLLVHKLKDPIFGLVTITNVKVTPDIREAKIYISVYEREKRQPILDKLNSIKKMLRTEVAQKVKLKHIPELFFYIDDTLDYVEKMENIFRKIHKNDNEENN